MDVADATVMSVRIVVRAFRAESPEEALAAARYWVSRISLPDRANAVDHISLDVRSRDQDTYSFTLVGTLHIAGEPAERSFRLECWRDRACVFALRCDVIVEQFVTETIEEQRD